MSNALPKTLLIGNIPYGIKVVEKLIDEDDRLLQGEIDYGKQTIKLSDYLSSDKAKKTLLHEVTHGILEEYGMSELNEEDFVDRLSVALYDFLTRNDLSFLFPKQEEKQNLSVSNKLLKLLTSEPAARETVKKLSAETKQPIEVVVKELTDEITSHTDSRPRRLPVVNPGTSTFNLGEIAKIKKAESVEPEYWRTGIKVIDDEKHYKTRYQCPECGNKGTRYLPEDYQYVICHSCDEEIQKIPATKEGFPHRDSWGNYFVTAGVNEIERD